MAGKTLSTGGGVWTWSFIRSKIVSVKSDKQIRSPDPDPTSLITPDPTTERYKNQLLLAESADIVTLYSKQNFNDSLL